MPRASKKFLESLKTNLESSCPKAPEAPAKIKSEEDPSKRTKNYKAPTPPEEWRPTWKARKTKPGLKGRARTKAAEMDAQDLPRLMESAERIGDVPIVKDAQGQVVITTELFGAICRFMEDGHLYTRTCRALGVRPTAMSEWIRRNGLQSEFDASRKRGVDAMVETALETATTPVELEEVTESYDGEGKLIRRDVFRGDSVNARKLAFQARMQVAAKWDPERYGDKIEVKTDGSTAEAIAAFRKRLRPSEDPVEDAVEVKG